jgi:hypothetical protein
VRVLSEDDAAGVGAGLLSIGDEVLLGVETADVVLVDVLIVDVVLDDVALVALVLLLLLLLDDRTLV